MIKTETLWWGFSDLNSHELMWKFPFRVNKLLTVVWLQASPCIFLWHHISLLPSCCECWLFTHQHRPKTVISRCQQENYRTADLNAAIMLWMLTFKFSDGKSHPHMSTEWLNKTKTSDFIYMGCHGPRVNVVIDNTGNADWQYPMCQNCVWFCYHQVKS